MDKGLTEQLKKEADNKCELCGRSRNLEIHHIVPRACSIDGVDIDSTDNLLVVCSRCHALLTPRVFLTKYGQAKVSNKNNIALSILNEFGKYIEAVEITGEIIRSDEAFEKLIEIIVDNGSR